jgi:hypothetical protein
MGLLRELLGRERLGAGRPDSPSRERLPQGAAVG